MEMFKPEEAVFQSDDDKLKSFYDQAEMISRTANALAHELKTPLTSIKLNVEMLDEDASLSENKKKSLAIIKKEITRLSGIVDSYLNLSRRSGFEHSEFRLYELIEDIHVQIRPELKKRNIAFMNKCSEYFLSGDRDKLRSVFLNLLSNSVEAIGENGNIEILTISDEQNGVHRILIKDDGCGVKDSSRIFQPFYTTKSNGNGLGLVLASEIIRKHNGKIRLLSSHKGETVFEISFHERNVNGRHTCNR